MPFLLGCLVVVVGGFFLVSYAERKAYDILFGK